MLTPWQGRFVGGGRNALHGVPAARASIASGRAPVGAARGDSPSGLAATPRCCKPRIVAESSLPRRAGPHACPACSYHMPERANGAQKQRGRKPCAPAIVMQLAYQNAIQIQPKHTISRNQFKGDFAQLVGLPQSVKFSVVPPPPPPFFAQMA